MKTSIVLNDNVLTTPSRSDYRKTKENSVDDSVTPRQKEASKK